jgi:cyclase
MKRLAVLAGFVLVGTLSIGAVLAQPTLGAIQIEKVRDNLYIVTGGRGTSAQGTGIAGNTTVYIADSGVVLIDTKYAGYGKAILDQIKTVTGKPITTIINTHTHADHTGANSEFPRAVEVVAHQNTKTNMARMDEFKGANAAFLPAKTFADTMTLLGGKDRIDLHYFGPGHTNGDAVIVFPTLRIAVMWIPRTAGARPRFRRRLRGRSARSKTWTPSSPGTVRRHLARASACGSHDRIP